MKVLIIEDEKAAANWLTTLINKYDNSIDILEKLDSVRKAAKWFSTNENPDLIFMDIQLADGLSFELFDIIEITTPVIFTTAYNEYAIKAFKVNSIDYLLKPLDFDELSFAINKFKNFNKNQPTITESPNIEAIQKAMTMLAQDQYKNRFIVKTGEHIKSISVDDIAYFYSWEKGTFLKTLDGGNHLIDYSLDKIEGVTDPKFFFRINRKYILRIEAVKDIVSYSNSRLQVKLLHAESDDIIVSRDRVQDFKEWLDR